ncbi:AMP-binding protein [Actinomadura alba]
MVFEHFAGAQRPVFHLDRPFDIAPEGGTRYTVADLADLIARTSGALSEAGLGPGDRMAVVKDNNLDVIVLAAAAARIGVLPALITPAVRTEHLPIMLERLDPKAVIASPGVLEAAEQSGSPLAGPQVTLIVAGRGRVPGGTVAFADLPAGEAPPATPRPDHEAMICTHTSGTTGAPKLVAHSANTMLGVIKRMEAMNRLPGLAFRPDDVMASCIAFVHGRAIAWIVQQLVQPPGEVVALSDSEPDNVAATLGARPPTIVESCPNIFQRWEGLTSSHPQVFRRVRAYLNTFDAIHPSTVRKFVTTSERRVVVWGQAWGQSETGPICMGVLTRRKVLRSEGASTPVTHYVGRSIPFVSRVRVVAPSDRRKLPRGEEGIVLVKTHGRCITYLGEDERYREKLWDGWWNTGDIGVKTRSGLIRLVDREVDTIPGASGIELESLLLERVRNATEIIVLGVPGRRPLPVVSTHDGDLDPAIWENATKGLPEMDPPVLIAWEEFPRTGTWKVRRHELREKVLDTTETHGTGRWT